MALVCLIAAASCGAGQIEPTQCGDGVVAGSEQCDDANLQDDDGCSATCLLEDSENSEDSEFACAESLSASRLSFGPGAMAASTDGAILVGGSITTQQGEAHGWIGAFDTQAEQLWSLELEDGDFVQALRPRDHGFLALVRGAGQSFRVVEIGASGGIGTQTVLATDARPRAMLDTPDGLLLAGNTNPIPTTEDLDLWLGRLGSGGTIEVLMTEDHLGFDDSFLAIEQIGDAIGVLASVGLINHSDGDLIEPDIEGAMLIEYDQSITEIHRTLIADEDLRVSWISNDLVVDPSGTWIIAGNHPGLLNPRTAWTMGIRDGETAWHHVIEAPELPGTLPHIDLRAGAAREHAFLVGGLKAEEGFSQLLLRLDPHSGTIIERADVVGGEDAPYFALLSTTTEDRGWFVGHAISEDEETLWLCNVRLY